MSRKILVPVADGTEEIEAVCIIDVLRRAGADVTVASVDGLQITASRGVRITADCLVQECRDRIYDLVVLPGGMPGAEHLRDSADLREILVRQHREGRFYGAICASPAVVLESHGLLRDRQATCHPGFMNRLPCASEDRIVVDGNCITSRGPGTALEFALKLVELLFDEKKAADVAAPMVMA